MPTPMNYRSTNLLGYSHRGHALVVGVEEGYGVEVNPASTGTAAGPNITSAGDDSTIALTVQAKGAAALNLGSATAPMNLNSTTVQFGSRSTSALAYIQRYRVDWTIPALSSAGVTAASADSTVTVAGATTNAMYILQQTQVYNSTNDPAVIAVARCSTANELRVTSINLGASTLSGSTVSGNLLQFGW